MRLFIVNLVLLTHYQAIVSQDWNYANLGPDVWSNTIPACAGRSQSPINIQTACTTYQAIAPFQFSAAYRTAQSFNLTNNGVTISTGLAAPGASSLILTGGGLDRSYEFLEFHLHWGENFGSGSEHEVNGIKYSGEIHFVHINRATNALAVLGFFIQSTEMTPTNAGIFSRGVNNATATEWNKYLEASKDLEQKNRASSINLNLAALMGSNLANFWRYRGSLTNPPCTEGVVWTVFTTPIIFPESLLNDFRTNLFSKNDRHPQPLNNRIVYRNYPNETITSPSDSTCCPRSHSPRLAIELYQFFFVLFVIFYLPSTK